jgi:hypothetical protein
MENAWEFLRANKLSARVWDSYEAIMEACADAWNWFVDDPDRIRSIGTRDCAKRSMFEAAGMTCVIMPFTLGGSGIRLNSGHSAPSWFCIARFRPWNVIPMWEYRPRARTLAYSVIRVLPTAQKHRLCDALGVIGRPS